MPLLRVATTLLPLALWLMLWALPVPADPDRQQQTSIDTRSSPPDVRAMPGLTPPKLAAAAHRPLGYGGPPRNRYPPAALRQGIEGTVVVRILVGVDGRALDAEIEQGVHPLLDEAALRWALRQSHDPATRNGIPYADWYRESVKFEIVD